MKKTPPKAENPLAKFAVDPAAFREALIVDVSGEPKRFGDCMDPWQRDDFAAIDPALKKCAGRSKTDAKNRIWLERPRGHSKTNDTAVTCIWALAFSSRPLKGVAFAKDKDQAGFLRDAIATIVRLNPWLADLIEVQKNSVINIGHGVPGEGGTLTISSSDVGSSYGLLVDFIICDELCHWEDNAGEQLWQSVFSTAAKRTNCMLVVISNAGFQESWQWRLREFARTDDAWIFSRLDGPQASWMTPETLAEQRRGNVEIFFRRVWLNEWSTGGGDALTPEDIAAAFDSGLYPMTGTRQELKDYYFVTGVDLGIKRDGSAVVTLAIPKGGFAGPIRLASHKLWRPPADGKKVDIREIELHILELEMKFGLEYVAIDTWNAELLAQRLEADTNHRQRNWCRLRNQEPWVQVVNATGSNLQTQASLTIEYFQDRRFQFYPCEPLRRDLLKVRVEERSYGFRLTSPRDEFGHGDNFSAFALALAVGHDFGTKKPVIIGSSLLKPRENVNPFQAELDSLRAQHEYEMELLRQPLSPSFPNIRDPLEVQRFAKQVNLQVSHIDNW